MAWRKWEIIFIWWANVSREESQKKEPAVMFEKRDAK